MPPTQEMIRKAVLCFAQMRLVKFTADKTQIRPGEGGVNLSWEVTLPTDCHVIIQLNGVTVPRKSSRNVNPVQSITYRLEARATGMGRPLGTIQIQVDTSNCTRNEISEAIVAPQVQQSVDESIDEYNDSPGAKKVSKRRETQVEIEATGIIVRLRMKIEIDNFFDPDLDIDAKIAVGISAEGRILAFYRSFSVDVDWPWWVTGISLGTTELMEKAAEAFVEKKLKNKVLNTLKSNLETAAEQFGGTISSVQLAQNEIIITTC